MLTARYWPHTRFPMCTSLAPRPMTVIFGLGMRLVHTCVPNSKMASYAKKKERKIDRLTKMALLLPHSLVFSWVFVRFLGNYMSLVDYRSTQRQTSQPATEVCCEMWVWSIASPPRGRVYTPRAQCGIIVHPKNHEILGHAPLGNNYYR